MISPTRTCVPAQLAMAHKKGIHESVGGLGQGPFFAKNTSPRIQARSASEWINAAPRFRFVLVLQVQLQKGQARGTTKDLTTILTVGYTNTGAPCLRCGLVWSFQ